MSARAARRAWLHIVTLALIVVALLLMLRTHEVAWYFVPAVLGWCARGSAVAGIAAARAAQAGEDR